MYRFIEKTLEWGAIVALGLAVVWFVGLFVGSVAATVILFFKLGLWGPFAVAAMCFAAVLASQWLTALSIKAGRHV